MQYFLLEVFLITCFWVASLYIILSLSHLLNHSLRSYRSIDRPSVFFVVSKFACAVLYFITYICMIYFWANAYTYVRKKGVLCVYVCGISHNLRASQTLGIHFVNTNHAILGSLCGRQRGGKKRLFVHL